MTWGATFQMMFAPGYILISIASVSAAALSRVFCLILQGSTSWGQAAVNGIATLGAAGLTFLAVWLKLRADRIKFNQTQIDKSQTVTTEATLRREELLDKRSDALFDDMAKYYAERHASQETIIKLMKENHAQEVGMLKEVIAHQQELITSQAATIQANANTSGL